MSGVHDMGGRPAGSINRQEHELAFFDKQVDALYVLLTSRKILTTDEVRREIEAHSVTDYFRLSYYEKWISAISRLLIEKGVFSQAELERKVEEIACTLEK